MRTVNIVIYFRVGEGLSIVKTLEAKNKTTTQQKKKIEHDFCRFDDPTGGRWLLKEPFVFFSPYVSGLTSGSEGNRDC